MDVGYGFYSIPYAAPPVGPLRYQPPQPIQPSAIPINASVSSQVACYQVAKNCSEGYCFSNVKEDCLVLDIHVPLTADLSNSNLPVMVWIPGGSFLRGSGTSPEDDGRWLSNATNSVVVSMNYRVGNQGIKDQQMALEWIQDNIRNFGGDTNQVLQDTY